MPLPLILALFAQFGALVFLLLGDILTRRRETELRLAARKQELFIGFLDVFGEVFGAFSGGKVPVAPDPKVVAEMARVGRVALLAASDEVVRAWFEFQRIGAEETDADKRGLRQMRQIGVFLIAMRKDVGHAKTILTEVEALQTFVRAEDWGQLANELI